MTKREKLVKAALAETGRVGGEGYVAWYNGVVGSRLALSAPWCAIFVSWCARKAGLTSKELPNFAGCTTGRRLFQEMGVWYGRDERVPRPGDLVFFDWDGDPTYSEHVGIVTGTDGSYLTTVEGNAGTPGTVRERRYLRKSVSILGYAGWKEKEEDMTREETAAMIRSAVKEMEETFAKALDEMKKAKEPILYNTLEEVPAWGREEVADLIRKGDLKGDETGKLGLSYDLVRAIVLMKRRERT